MRKKYGATQNTRNTTPLSGHRRIGKTLVPPMMRLPTPTLFSSWANDRLPEMLWAALVITVLRREDALRVFREVASIGVRYGAAGDKFKSLKLNLSSLATQPPELISEIVGITKRHHLGEVALRPLLLIHSLPARDVWRTEIKAEPVNDDWQTLAKAVLGTFDHQSQEATDVRWLRLMFKICLGAMLFPKELAERAEELRLYPHKGDMKAVRPFIRASEISLEMGPEGETPVASWPGDFWAECMNRTACVGADPPKDTRVSLDIKAFCESLMDARVAVMEHWGETLSTTGVDARHDTVFSFALYALSCVLEMASASNSYGISGRLFLRCLAECRITLAFLVGIDDTDFWKRFRSYGSGQAKLALLKMEEVSGRKAAFVERRTLEALANEDFFQEFVNIDLGHWCGKDLRRMAEDSGTKDDYDKFYGWASGFVHGQWGALRDSNLTHCINPLHRFHRVPLPTHRLMSDSLGDAVALLNSILETVEIVYPGTLKRLDIPHPLPAA